MANSTFKVDNGIAVTGNGSVSGALSVANTLAVTGNVTISNSVAVTGGITATQNVAVDTNVLFVDTVNNRVGINIAAPSHTLTVVGSANVTADVYIGGNLIVSGTTTTTAAAAVSGNQIPTVDGVALGNTINRFDMYIRNGIVYGYLNGSANGIPLGNNTGRFDISANNISISGGAYPISNGIPLGNTINRFEVFANSLNASNTITIGIATVNSTIYTGTANNSNNFNGQNSAFYANATNLTTGTLPYGRIPVNVVNTTSGFTLAGAMSFSNTVTFSNVVTLSANVALSGAILIASNPGTAGQVLLSTGTSVEWGSVSAASQEYRTMNAGWALSGGGLVTWTGSAVLWSQRVIAMPVEKTEFGASGYIQIDCPTSGTVVYYNSAGATTTATCTAAGIPLTQGDAIYYKVTPGMAASSDQTKFVVANYQNATWAPTEGWLMIAVCNGDGTNVGHLKFIPAQMNIPSIGSTVTYNVGTGVIGWPHIVANTGIVSNTSGVFVNSSYVAVQSANNTFSGNNNFTGGNTTFSGSNTHFTGRVNLTGMLTANASAGTNGQFLASNGSVSYWSPVNVPKTTSTTLGAADVGKCTAVSGTVTVPNSIFAAGDVVSIYNDSASAITITASITTLRLAGTATTGNRTLAARGMATIWFNSSTEGIISGSGLS